jgi:hypothetical protein
MSLVLGPLAAGSSHFLKMMSPSGERIIPGTSARVSATVVGLFGTLLGSVGRNLAAGEFSLSNGVVVFTRTSMLCWNSTFGTSAELTSLETGYTAGTNEAEQVGGQISQRSDRQSKPSISVVSLEWRSENFI